jgi:DNA-nicking Smr family endonuclease
MAKKKKRKPTKGVGESAPAAAPEAFRPFAELLARRRMTVPVVSVAPTPSNNVRAVAPSPSKPLPSRAARAGEAAQAQKAQPTNEDDALALHRMMSGVTPLDGKKMRIPRSEGAFSRVELDARRDVENPERAEAEAVHEHLRALVGDGQFEVQDDGRRVEGRRSSVTPDVVRRLRRGLLPIDGRIDLHGMRADEARVALDRFLAEQRARGERCVLVVHGKGEHSPAGVGILRGEIAAWLSQGRAGAHVAAFATAREDDGGEGAVYVLLGR